VKRKKRKKRGKPYNQRFVREMKFQFKGKTNIPQPKVSSSRREKKKQKEIEKKKKKKKPKKKLPGGRGWKGEGTNSPPPKLKKDLHQGRRGL